MRSYPALRSFTALTRTVLILGAALCVPGLLGAQEEPTEPFPHDDHAGLFPLCTGCHAAAKLEAGDLYPEPELCVRCHDGVQEDEVVWEGPSVRPTNVSYEHIEHDIELDRAGDDPLECSSCHAETTETRWDVLTASLGSCWGCHAHEREEHYEATDCNACHVPLSESRIETEDYLAWTAPADHDAPSYLATDHGAASLDAEAFGTCATCHTSERCTSCHVDGERAPIPELGYAPGSIRLPTYPATYPTPESHALPDWLEDHNTLASRTECATCHTQQDCATCHLSPVPAQVADVPARSSSLAPGVGLERTPPATHERPDFGERHGADAAADDRLCASCHRPVTCVSCHLGGGVDTPPPPSAPGAPALAVREVTILDPAGQPTFLHVEPATSQPSPLQPRGFHAPEYDLRHAADAWGGGLECGNCHNTVVFCRSCHVESGLGSSGRLGKGYHDAAGPWILRHGQAARQALESCASCHEQRECMQCHSTNGGFRVSPHGPDFDADLAWEKGGRTCFACHPTRPVGGGS